MDIKEIEWGREMD